MSRRVGAVAAVVAAVSVALILASASAAATPADGARSQVSRMFADYRRALLARDFRIACRLTAPETDRALIANLAGAGLKARTCEEAFGVIYSPTRDGGRTPRLADAITRTTRVIRITVTGSRASIRWSAELDGERVTVTNTARQVGSSWQLVDTD